MLFTLLIKFRKLRRPWCWLVLGSIAFFLLGTFYWSLWEIPLFSFSSSSSSSSSSEQIEKGTVNVSGVAGVDDTTAISLGRSNSSIFGQRPLPLQCSQGLATPVEPHQNFCRYNTTLEECYRLLMPILHEQPSWVFLGDYNMQQLSYFISMKWPFTDLTITSRRNPCQNMNYYRLPPPIHGWVPPNPLKGEGPIGYGKDHPYCMDCMDCWNVLMTNGPPINNDTAQYVEYLVVEYTRDVSLPTEVSTTTQETAAYYLQSKSPAVCVATAGLNDAAIVPSISTDVYLANVDAYITLLRNTCRHILWIGMPAILEQDAASPSQNNCQLYAWNQLVYSWIGSKNYSNVYAIDIWTESLQTDHISSLRLSPKFYATFARLFTSLMAGPNMSQ